jgi:signal transduction histidine kinase
MSRLSYNFVKDLYLEQISEKVNIVSALIASQINSTYLNTLEFGPPTVSTENYFRDLFRRNSIADSSLQIFIFDKEFKIIVNSDSNFKTGAYDSRLLLNEKEITELKINQSSVSLPFKGDDDNWYLWGFYRLNENYWLSLRESVSKLERVDEFSNMFWIIGFIGIVFTFVLSLLIAKSISKPVDKLTVYSSEIGKGNFNTEMPDGIHGEIKTLALAMDKMKLDLSENQKEREKMLAQIAHEIRNPLGGIELLAGLSKEDFAKANLNTGYLDKILSEVQGLKKLINSFLEFSRPVPAKQEISGLGKIVNETLNNLKAQIDEKRINITVDLKKEEIVFDSTHLKQILLNLLTNSIQAVVENGSISVTSGNKKNKWFIHVSDDGPGIPEDSLSTIFELFYTTKKTGSGLGLAISKKLCVENKAMLNVKNNPGKGCIFTIEGEINNEI